MCAIIISEYLGVFIEQCRNLNPCIKNGNKISQSVPTLGFKSAITSSKASETIYLLTCMRLCLRLIKGH